MSSKWFDEDVAKKWISAQAGEGDEWRQKLTNRLVRSLLLELRSGGKPFEFPAVAALGCTRIDPDTGSTPRAFKVVDLGCGEGCLSVVVAESQGDYVGIDGSPPLVRHARENRGLKSVELGELDDMMEPRSRAFIRDALDPDLDARPTLVTMITVLEALKHPAPLLQLVGHELARHDEDTPLLVVTLDSNWFKVPSVSGSGETATDINVDSASFAVSSYIRSHRSLERLFRNAGLMVRACEPLHFAAADQDQRYLPTFWAWRLSARRVLREPPPTVDQWQAWLEGTPRDFRAFANRLTRREEWRDAQFFQVPAGKPLIVSQSIGGEWVLLLDGHAVQRKPGKAAEDEDGHQEVFHPGAVFGFAEASEPRSSVFTADIVAGNRPCEIAVLGAEQVSRIMKDDKSRLHAFIASTIRRRVQLDAWTTRADVKKGWKKKSSKRAKRRKENDGAKPSNSGGQLSIDLKTFCDTPADLQRVARPILFNDTVESRARSASFRDGVVFISLAQIARSSMGDPQRRVSLSRAPLFLHLLRILDVLPIRVLAEAPGDAATEALRLVIEHANEKFLGVAPEEPREPADRALLDQTAAELNWGKGLLRLRTLTEQIVSETILKKAVRDQHAQVDAFIKRKTEAQTRALERWVKYLTGVSRFWDDGWADSLVIVVRDRPALRRIALAEFDDFRTMLSARALHVVGKPTLGEFASALREKKEKTSKHREGEEPERPSPLTVWRLARKLTSPARQAAYLEAATAFARADVGYTDRMLFSHDLVHGVPEEAEHSSRTVNPREKSPTPTMPVKTP